MKEIPSWLDKDGIQIAKKINSNKGKAHAINYLAEMAKGKMSNKLVWAKDFYDQHINQEQMEGYKTYRHKSNPKEKEFHDKFLEGHNREGYADMELIVFGHYDDSLMPKDYLSDREKKIVLSTIQWLGSPVGQSFLNDCGFTKI